MLFQELRLPVPKFRLSVSATLRGSCSDGYTVQQQPSMPGPPTILLVDDNPSHLKIYELLLERAGYRPLRLEVDGGPVALPEEQIDLVLLDYRLPGEHTAARIAEEARQTYGAVPIIVLSDVMWMPDEMLPRADHFVRKGEPELLLQSIAEALPNS